MVHDLKVHPLYYQRIMSNEKNFEVRKADRDFQVGDILNLREWCPQKQDYTGMFLPRRITYILRGGQFGIEEGYCVLSLTL
jgi:hypothetical protein